MGFRQRLGQNRCRNVEGTGKERDNLTNAALNFKARAVSLGHTQTSESWELIALSTEGTWLLS